MAERSSQINQQAAMEVKRNLTALQDELLALRQEVTFYRNIVSPPDAKPGLRVQSLKLEKGSAEGLFRFKLVLTQVKGNDQLVRGAVNLMVEGHEAGEQKGCPWRWFSFQKGENSSLVSDTSRIWRASFSYRQGLFRNGLSCK